MRPIIHVRNLGKRYYLRPREETPTTLREAFLDALSSAGRGLAGRAGPGRSTHWALKDVSFDVYPGEVVGVIGRNGAGKSTLLKILSRIVKPTTGAADIYGRVGSLLGVGTGFHPDLTGRENVFLNGAILGMRRDEIARKFDEIVSFAEVEKFLDTPVKRYSSGMYLRLAFAVAAHLDHEILLLDEVLAVGDHAFQKKCLGKMREVSRVGRTALFVSHNMAAVQQFCERVLFIRAGGIGEDGPPDAAIADYLEETSGAAAGVFDLSQGRGRPVIRRLTLFGAGAAPTARFRTGERVVAELTLSPDVPLREPRISLGVEDGTGRRITTVASHFQPGPLGGLDAPCVVRCTLPNLALGSGHYFLSLRVEDRYVGLVDVLDSAAGFEVVWHNGYGNGEQYRPSYGPVITHSVWERLE